MRYRLALFDIDGTLCDPGDGITDAVDHALHAVGIEETDPDALRRFVGPPLEHSFRDYYDLEPGDVDTAVAAYRRRYETRGLDQYTAYPRIDDTLRRLSSHGIVLGVVTAKIQAFAEQALRGTSLLQHFTTVHGRAPDEVVDKSVTLGHALQEHRADLDSTVMIGDREHDIHAARHHGINSIGVLYGFGTRDELGAAGATHLADHPPTVEHLVSGGHRR